MNTLRLPEPLLRTIEADLSRGHEFAFERVGFLLTRRLTSALGDVLLARDWVSVSDDDYMRDETVGARLSGRAIRKVLAHGLAEQVGVLHVHAHGRRGTPAPSGTDDQTFEELTPSLAGVAPEERHGAVIFSLDDACARLLGPMGSEPLRVIVVGRPLRFWSRRS
jgi:hypothetical protein